MACGTSRQMRNKFSLSQEGARQSGVAGLQGEKTEPSVLCGTEKSGEAVHEGCTRKQKGVV